jgi:hypothetical protein
VRSPQFALENRVEVMRGEAHPLRPISYPMHRAAQRLSSLNTVAHVRSRFLADSLSGADADPPRHVAGGASLGRSRPLASFVIPPGTALFGSDAERQLPAPRTGLRRYSASYTRENQAPTRCRGLGDSEHELNAFHRVVRAALAHFSELSGGGFDPTVTQLAHPFATSPPRSTRLAATR